MTRLERKKQHQQEVIDRYHTSMRRNRYKIPGKYLGVKKRLKGLRGVKKGLLSKKVRVIIGERILRFV